MTARVTMRDEVAVSDRLTDRWAIHINNDLTHNDSQSDSERQSISE